MVDRIEQQVKELVTAYHERFGILPPVHKPGEANLAGMFQGLIHAGRCTTEDVQEYINQAQEKRLQEGIPIATYPTELPFPEVYR